MKKLHIKGTTQLSQAIAGEVMREIPAKCRYCKSAETAWMEKCFYCKTCGKTIAIIKDYAVDLNATIEIGNVSDSIWLGLEHGEWIAKVWSFRRSRSTHPTSPAIALCLAVLKEKGYDVEYEETQNDH